MKRLSRIIILSLIFAFAVVLTVFSGRASGYAREGLSLCATCIIPSLFPYMVISHMIISGGACSFIGKILPIARLYGLPRDASAPIFLGSLCGFPVGAKAACELYKKGALTKTEAEVLISAANNTGPSFVVSVIGGVFFKSAVFGWILYSAQLFSSLIAAIIVNRLIFPFKRREDNTVRVCESNINFFSAVSDSASSVITVCGFIVFFSVIFGFSLPYITDLSPTFAGILSSILEFTGGCEYAAALGGAKGRFLCGLAVGWSGLSVFCQSCAFTAPLGLSQKRTLCTKALQGALTGAIVSGISIDQTKEVASIPFLYSEASLMLSSPAPVILISAALYVFVIKKLSLNHKM